MSKWNHTDRFALPGLEELSESELAEIRCCLVEYSKVLIEIADELEREDAIKTENNNPAS